MATTKKTKKKAAKKKTVKQPKKGLRHAGPKRDAAVELLRTEDPTTVAGKTGFAIDSLRRWGKAAGITLIDGRTARAKARGGASGKVQPRLAATVERRLPTLAEPVVILRIEGLTEYLDELVELKFQAFFKNMKVKTAG